MIYLELLWTFFKIGAFTFGGGYAMLPLIQEQVIAHGWLSQEELLNFIAVSEGTPGPFAVNVSTYVGMETAGILGALCATLGVVLPSFGIILIVAKCFQRFRQSQTVRGLLSGLKPAVVGLIATAVLTTGQAVFFPVGVTAAVLTSPAFYTAAGIFLLCLILALKKLHPIWIILISAVLGIAAGSLFPGA